MEKTAKFIASFFCLGYAPAAPGTFGSLGGLLIYFLVKDNAVIFTGLTIAIFILGLAFCGIAERAFGKKDSQKIVIDEACGMMASLLFLPRRMWLTVAAFGLFRLFDIIKPPPIKKIEALPGGYGIMLDDIAAAVYTNLTLQIIVNIQKRLF